MAKLAGTSSSTVSIVLNKQEKERKIPPSTVERVHDAIKALNYQPSVSARKLRDKKKNEITIGVYWASDFRSNYLARFINGIQKEILKSSKEFNLIICPYKNGDLKNEEGIKNISTFHFAVIAATSEEDMAYLENNSFPIPIVLFNRLSSKFHTVVADYNNSAITTVNFLKHKSVDKICIVSSYAKYIANRMRRDAIINLCSINSIDTDTFEITTENSLKGGFEAAQKYMAMTTPPKIIYCDTDTIAKGMISAFYQASITVPAQVEIIAMGMDNPDTSEYSVPPLTVIHLPLEEMSAECIRIISDILDDKIDTVARRVFNTKLIIRESCPEN